jgi:hypothetical protein
VVNNGIYFFPRPFSEMPSHALSTHTYKPSHETPSYAPVDG